MTDDIQLEPGSFRDRSARVFYAGEGVYRGLNPAALLEWQRLEGTQFYRRSAEKRQIIATSRVKSEQFDGQHWAAVLQHARVPFISYPYEWCFGMLKDAAALQLDLLADALVEGMILKDASPYNVQWVGAHPVFIDVASFHQIREGQPWEGYRQFCQLFLYPLMLQAYKDIAFHPWLRGSLEGIESEDCAAIFSTADFFRRGIFTHVYLQSKVQSRYASGRADVRAELSQAGFSKTLIEANVRRLRALIDRLEWKRSQSEWSDYTRHHTYDSADQQRKEAFVRSAANSRHSRLVWDLGSNTGSYSRIAAESADYVVAIDADHLAVERLYRALKNETKQNILPMVGNLANPSPNLGWRGEERKPLPDRGKPDLVLALALIHHVVIGANIPLVEFLDWLAGLGADLVIEFVSKDDPMVRALLKNRVDQYPEYTEEGFEHHLEGRFEIVSREPLGTGSRILYHGRNRGQR